MWMAVYIVDNLNAERFHEISVVFWKTTSARNSLWYSYYHMHHYHDACNKNFGVGVWDVQLKLKSNSKLTKYRCFNCFDTFHKLPKFQNESGNRLLNHPAKYNNDVIIGEIASQITSLTIVYSTIYSDADQIKYQSSASLAFVRGIHRGQVNSPHKWPVMRRMFPFDDVIMENWIEGNIHCVVISLPISWWLRFINVYGDTAISLCTVYKYCQIITC